MREVKWLRALSCCALLILAAVRLNAFDDNSPVPPNAETLVQLSQGNLLITDVNHSSDDLLTLSREGPNLRVRDPKNVLYAASGTIQIDPFTVEVPFDSITGLLRIDTGGGDDLVTLDLTNGNVIPAGGIVYDGGANGALGD